MIEKIMKAVKRNNKRRSVNITVGAVVGFLLSCTAVMGTGVTIGEVDGGKFGITSTVIEGSTFENNTYTNNGEMKTTDAYGIVVSGTPTDTNLNIVNNGSIVSAERPISLNQGAVMKGKIINNGSIESKSVGVFLMGALEGDIINNGTIKISYSGINLSRYGRLENIINKGEISSGYDGIEIRGTMTGSIENEGIINNKSVLLENGEFAETSNINIYKNGNDNGIVKENIKNTGVLKSENIATVSDGGIKDSNNILVVGTVEKSIENLGTITSKAVFGSSNNINIKNIIGYYIGKVEGNIINRGVLKSESTGTTGTSAGINIEGTLTESTTNRGRIISNAVANSYGFIGTNEMKAILSYGYLDIKSTGNDGIGIEVSKASSSGVGVGNYGNIKVAGSNSTGIRVLGEMKGTYNHGLLKSLNGSGISSERTTSGLIHNYGVIYGKTSALNQTKDITETFRNYGVMVTDGNERDTLLSGKLTEKLTTGGKSFGDLVINYGLAFSVGTGENAGKYFLQEITNEVSAGDYEIKNAELKKSANYGTTGEISGTENILSSEFYKSEAQIDKHRINGIDDTLVLDRDGKTLNDSIINSYKRALVMGENLEFTAKGTTFNGGVDEVSETILLKGNNTLNLSRTSIINGNTKIDGTGNTYTMNGSIQNGDIETGSEGGNTLSLNNGSALNGEARIKGDGNSLSISGSMLNGEIAINGSGNIVNISGENTYLNGNMASTGNNTLNLGGKSTNGSSLNMFHEVDGFNNMSIAGGNVTFFEDSRVTGVENLTVAQNGTLNLRLEKTGTQNTDGLNEATHAFSNNGQQMLMEGLDSGGTLKFVTNGIGQGAYIDIGDMQIKNMKLETSSVLDKYKFDGNGGLVLKAVDDLGDMNTTGTIIVDSTLPGGGSSGDGSGSGSDDEPGDILGDGSNIFDENFDAINNIYGGLFSSREDNLDALRDLILLDRNSGEYNGETSKEEQLRNLQAYLNEIYTQSPYTLSSELSRKSAGMFRDIVVENLFRPNLNQWMVMGGLTHVDGGTKDTYYGEVYEMDGKNSLGTDVDMKLTGAYALGKYGYSENVALGVTVGGNRSEAELSRSKVKGNSGYIGAFAENYRGNLTLKAGAGVQYSEYDADRGTIGGHSYSDKYSDMTYDIYLNGRYSNAVGENLFLEPYATLSYTYVDQDGTDEGSKALAIETDSKSFEYTAAKVGVDLKKVIPHKNGKSTLSAGLSYTKLLSGADADNLTGRFKDGKDFDIMVASKNEHSLGVNAKYALELQSGILFDVKGSYSFERDSHNGNAKNRNKGEWIVGAGLGYKF